MNSNREDTKNPKKTIRPPYSANEVNFLDSWIEDGLRVLKDVGKTVNYEEMCERMLNSIPNNYFTPEYISYIKYWQERFKEISSKRDRNKKFEEFVKDLSAR